MAFIIDFGKADQQLQKLEHIFREHFPEVILVGPTLIQEDLSSLTFTEYENKFKKVSETDVVQRIADLVPTGVLLVLPRAVYDIYFNSCPDHWDANVAEERDFELFSYTNTELKLYKVIHHAAVILRNRGVRPVRSAITESFLGGRMTYTRGDWTVIMGWIHMAKRLGFKAPDVSTYVDLSDEEKYKKFATVNEFTNLIQAVCFDAQQKYILILPDIVYSFYLKNQKRFKSSFSLVVMSENSLTFDPTQNVFVPLHELATNREVEELKSRFSDIDALPKILSTDMIVKWIGFEKKSVLRITRTKLNRHEVYYRIVV